MPSASPPPLLWKLRVLTTGAPVKPGPCLSSRQGPVQSGGTLKRTCLANQIWLAWGWAGCWGKAFIGEIWGFPDDSVGKESTCDVRRGTGDSGSIPGSGRSPGQGNGNPFHYSCLKNPTDRGAWWARVEKVAKSWTCLSS